jgi:ribulose-phosphate 3-epimerase
VTVNILEVQAQKVFIVGEVNTPAVLQLSAPMTVVEALTRAGGINQYARTSNVLLVRGGIEQPELYLKEWMRVADRIIVHPESTSHLDQIIKEFEHSPVKLGVALLLQTELEKFAAELERVSLIQLMGIEKIGHQGELFAEQTLERVRLLREQYPSVTISVDGGVTLENAPRLIAAGANQLVIGSAIWQAADPIAAIKEFQKLVV